MGSLCYSSTGLHPAQNTTSSTGHWQVVEGEEVVYWEEAYEAGRIEGRHLLTH